jgi:segregation and condensation protein A
VAIPGAQISVETRIEQLLARLSETEACGFEDLFEDAHSKQDVIITFLALLEMIRTRVVRVFQAGMFGSIRVYKRAKA